MATRRQTPPQVGQFYHVYNRGNNHQRIFFDRENYLYFLRLTKRHLVANGVDVVAYCLMPNHYHFLMHLSEAKLSASMKSLSLAYTKAINKRYNRCGSLFQGRFQSLLVAQTDHLINLSRYIHLNPVKAKLVQHPSEWEFSSYLEYAGLRLGTLPQMAFIKAQMVGEQAYQQFLQAHHLPDQVAFKALLIDD